MSYILDALEKAEYEREMAQFVDYGDNYNKKRWVPFLKHSWLWVMIILAINILVFVILLWLLESQSEPQMYIVPPTVPNSVSLSEELSRSSHFKNKSKDTRMQ